jgi:hypothetical protein
VWGARRLGVAHGGAGELSGGSQPVLPVDFFIVLFDL